VDFQAQSLPPIRATASSAFLAARRRENPLPAVLLWEPDLRRCRTTCAGPHQSRITLPGMAYSNWS
jgi:hypothetical protein